MKRAIIEFNQTGECKIDINKCIKYWNLLCRIYANKDNYTLAEFTLKGKCKFKIRIYESDANELIESLNLRVLPNDIFKNSKTYLIV